MKISPIALFVINGLSLVANIFLLVFAVISHLFSSIALSSLFVLVHIFVLIYISKRFSVLNDDYLKLDKIHPSLPHIIISFLIMIVTILLSTIFHFEIFNALSATTIAHGTDDVFQGMIVCLLPLSFVFIIELVFLQKLRNIIELLLQISKLISVVIISISVPCALLIFIGQFLWNVTWAYILYYSVIGVNVFALKLLEHYSFI